MDSFESNRSESSNKEHKVIVYSTPACPYCIIAKQYFKQIKIDFKEYDVSVDKEKAREMMEKSGQMGVPVIDIDGHIVIGFDRKMIDKLLGK
ncbi:glutathione S-transferase N-terminal domain-containing protein [Candidatus Micrarchaeota archaeon]|nr:glutathione S-transferase N-terminal domain-containing protein [Candidatus Micrarchaeota archaeon]